jgi:hypothetical protein
VKVFVKGQGPVTLTQQHFVAVGGQASVYVRNGTAYKIYTDPAMAIPYAKFQALSVLTDPSIVKPQNMLLKEATDVPVGYTMRAVPDSYSLCQLFTKAFRDRNNVTQDQIVQLAEKLQEHVRHVHKAGVLIVDLNELNLLVPKTLDDVVLIDVDSYQTPGFPATVIMPSVRDYSVKAADFSPLSDWFSYAVLAFQLFVGAHPYKGVHQPTMAIDKDKRLEHRMRQNISAFDPAVALPKVCYPFDAIPPTFRSWLKAVLQDGKRLPPPSLLGVPAAVVTTPMTTFHVASGNLIINEVLNLEGRTLVQYVESNGLILSLTTKGPSDMRIEMNGRLLYSGPHLSGQTLLGFTPKMNEPVALNLHNGQLTFLDLSRRHRETLGISALEIAKSGDRFYVRNEDQVMEVDFAELSGKIIVTASHAVAHTLELSSKLYEGAVIQNMLGSIFVSLFPKSRSGYQIRIPELDRYRIQDAKFDGGVLMVVGSQDGIYDRLIFRFDTDFTTYTVRVVKDVTPSGLNFVTLASGVCVSMTEDEKIEAFSVNKDSQGLKVVEDPALGNDMRLLKVGGKVGFERAGKIYQMSLK